MNPTISSSRRLRNGLAVAATFLSMLVALRAGADELLYVGNSGEESVAVISVPQHQIVRTLHIAGEPDDIVGSSDGRILYVSTGKSQGEGRFPDSGSVLAIATDTGKQLWQLPVDGWPHHISLSSDDQRLYVPVFDRDHTLVVDTRKHQVESRLHATWGMHGTRLSTDDKKLYAGSMLTSMLFVFDTDSGKLASTIPFPEGVRPFAVTRDQRLAYVQLSKAHGFSVVDLTAGKTVRTVDLPALPTATRLPDRWPFNVDHGLELSPDEKYLLAAGSIVGTVEIYSHPQLRHLKTIQVADDPNWIVFSSDGRYAYVSCRSAGKISVIDMSSLTEVKRIENVGKGPARMRIVSLPRA
jgi:DNA-binding beta-propeller fold protein YncE